MLLSLDCQNRIADLYLSGKQPSASPCAWFMCGLPGSGKTSFVRQGLTDGRFPSGAFLMDPDGIMENIPGYKTDLSEAGPEAAFLKWEMAARSLAYAMLETAREKRFDIIIDMGHALPESRDVIDGLRKSGYRTIMYYINCAAEICIQRATLRPRYLPPEFITQRYGTLEKNLGYFREIMDHFEEINGNLSFKPALTS